MSRIINLTGRVFGRWTVLKRAKNRGRCHYWLCLCECGTEKEVDSASLRRGTSKSCGCLRIEKLIARSRERCLPNGQACFNQLYAVYRISAKNRGLIFNLSKKDFRFLTKMNCFYCGKEPSRVKNCSRCNGSYIYTGIDRVDNTKGYELHNIVPCCSICNRMKMDMSVLEFLSHVRKINTRDVSTEI